MLCSSVCVEAGKVSSSGVQRSALPVYDSTVYTAVSVLLPIIHRCEGGLSNIRCSVVAETNTCDVLKKQPQSLSVTFTYISLRSPTHQLVIWAYVCASDREEAPTCVRE